jgi:hypothetical protein
MFTSKGGSRSDESLGPPSIHFTRTSTISHFKHRSATDWGSKKGPISTLHHSAQEESMKAQGLGKEMDENLVGGLPQRIMSTYVN